MENLNIATKLNAFTRQVKDGAKVIREAIPKFDFAVDVSFERNSKLDEVITTLIINAIKNDIQATDRESLWTSEVIAENFATNFNSYNTDKLYSLVCLNTSGRFGIKSFVEWVELKLIPAIETAQIVAGKSLNDKMKTTIVRIAKLGNKMPEQEMATMLGWIEKYSSPDDESLEEVIKYLTQEVVATSLSDLGI